jgi:Putative adhesin
MQLTSGRLATVSIGVPVALAMTAWVGFSLIGLAARASEQHAATYAWAGGDISVNAGSGDVVIQGGPGSDVGVTYTEHYGLKKPTVSATTKAGGVQLVAKCPNSLLNTNCAVNYVLHVPAAAHLVLHTGNGSLRVVGVAGAETLDTGNGGITLEGVTGAVVAHTGNGDVSGSELASASVEAHTGNGGVHLSWTAAPTQVSATTGNGDVRVVVPAGSGPYRVSTHTGTGSSHVAVASDPSAVASIVVDTGSGGITIGYPG